MLPLTSKVIENVAHDQANTFLKSRNLLHNYQFGFEFCNKCSQYLHA